MAEMLVRVYIHTHGNLINEKEKSIKDALLMIHRKDR